MYSICFSRCKSRCKLYTTVDNCSMTFHDLQMSQTSSHALWTKIFVPLLRLGGTPRFGNTGHPDVESETSTESKSNESISEHKDRGSRDLEVRPGGSLVGSKW